jgi:hypothetical protein
MAKETSTIDPESGEHFLASALAARLDPADAGELARPFKLLVTLSA